MISSEAGVQEGLLIPEAELRAYRPQPVDASHIRHIHFIGIAGTGMGTLAGLFKQAGYHITGSDEGIYPPMSDQLQAWKIPVNKGFSEKNLEPAPDLVVVGNVCRPSNIEVQAAVARGLSCTSMPRALHDLFLRQRQNVVIAGTHGKTTTTALVAWLLQQGGLQPGLLVGGVCPNFDGSFQLPQGPYFVVEGDEYDSALFDKVPKFVHYAPSIAVLTSVEFDHGDIYADLKAVKNAFRLLIEQLPPEGLLLLCGEYQHAQEAALGCRARRLIYGLNPDFELHADRLVPQEEGIAFDLWLRGEPVGSFLLPMFGQHNVTNALAAIGIALHLGLSPETIQEGLSSFQGIKRRQEIVAQIGDILIIDDFAHHPTAIQATSEGIRERYPQRRLWGIFEPRSNTARRNYFQELLPQSFDACDRVILARPYLSERLSEGERLDVDQVIDALRQRDKEAMTFPDVEAIVSYITAKARPQDIFLIMSNGAFGGIHSKLAAALEQRFQP